jgi:predicted AAA+ superfamily ATPase
MERSCTTRLNQWYHSKKRRPLVIRGARQVGKSTLVRMFASANRLDLLEINLERHTYLNKIFATYDMQAIITALEDVAGKNLSPQSLLFLDEIQATPQGLAALRYFFEDRPNIPVIAAGSLLELLVSEIEFSMPVGRIDYFYMGPCNFAEYLTAAGEDRYLAKLKSYKIGSPWSEVLHDQLMIHLERFMMVGGMPEPLSQFIENSDDTQGWTQAQQRIIDTYADDFNKYRRRGDWAPILQEVYRRLPAFYGKKIKYTELAPGQRVEKIHKVLDLLAAARLIHRTRHVSPPAIPLKAHASHKIYKIYSLDIGLFHRQLGRPSESLKMGLAPTFRGLQAEQFVAQHLGYQGAPTLEPELYYWLREGKADNAEVDFIATYTTFSELEIIPIEVKSSPSGKMRSLMEYIKHYHPRIAVRFYNGQPQIDEDLGVKLLSLPIYMAPFLRDLLKGV